MINEEKNCFLKGMLLITADSFAAVYLAIMFENALVRVRRVEVRKSLLMPAKSIKFAPKVASSAISTVSLLSARRNFACCLPCSQHLKPPDKNANALAETKHALQSLG